MMTTGVYILLAVAIMSIAFILLTARFGARAAFLAVCWVPMAGLLAAIGLHHHLGYSVFAVLGATFAASGGLGILGARLASNARRRTMATKALVMGTVFACLPLALLVCWLIVAASGDL